MVKSEWILKGELRLRSTQHDPEKKKQQVDLPKRFCFINFVPGHPGWMKTTQLKHTVQVLKRKLIQLVGEPAWGENPRFQ